MFKYFREEMSGTTMMVVLVLLVVSFASWGLHGIVSQNSDIVASSHGVDVDRHELSRIYKLVYDSANPEFREALKKSDELKNKTINSLANNLLLKKIIVQNLSQAGFVSSNDMQLAELNSIKKRFGTIKQFLDSYMFTNETIYKELEQNSIYNQLSLALKLATPIWTKLRILNNKSINTSKIITIKKIDAPKVQVSSEEINSFYKTNINQYQSKISAEVTEYHAVMPKIKDDVNSLLSFYNSHIDWYIQPASVSASIYKIKSGILSELDFLSDTQRAELQANHQNLEKYMDRRFVETTTEPGLFAQLQVLANGESDFVMLDGKEVLVKVNKKQQASTPDFSAVEAQVKKDYIKTKHQELLDQSKLKLQMLSDSNNLGDKDIIVKHIKIGDFEHYGPSLPKNWLQDTNNINKNKIIELNNTMVLVKLNKINLPTALPFSEIKSKVEEDLIKLKKLSLQRIAAKKLQTDLNFSGDEYTINLSKSTLQSLPVDKLMQLQFYPDASSLIFEDQGQVFVARLLKILPAKDVAPTLLQTIVNSYGRDSSRVFTEPLLN